MKTCLACGMPLIDEEDFSMGDMTSDFCLYCTNDDGSVKSCEEIFEGGVDFFVNSTGIDREDAEKLVRKNMSDLPYWQDKDCEILEGEMATDEEYEEFLEDLG